jgi:hypothetical protein
MMGAALNPVDVIARIGIGLGVAWILGFWVWTAWLFLSILRRRP